MLTALLKFVELVMEALKNQASSDKRRRGLAHIAQKLYIDIDDIVLRGNRLLDLFGSESTVVSNEAIDVLLAQQASLSSITEHLRDIEPILRIHFPFEMNDLKVAIEFKGTTIVFLLDWLLNVPIPEDGRPFALNDSYARLTPQLRRLLLTGRFSAEELALEEQSDDPLDPWDILSLYPVSHYQLPNHVTWRPILVATPQDIQKAKETLDKFDKLREQLRVFLIENFKPEDLL